MEVDNSDGIEKEMFAEVDPSGRYGRYVELLGSGSFKKVYRAFDQEDGIEVTWNKVKLRQFTGKQKKIDQLFSEVELLRSLKHDNIISLFAVWKNKETNTLNFLTDFFTSGDLRAYREKHRRVFLKCLKKWCKQILKGLNYMHTQDPCIIHRDLKSSNIFINGNTGELKIGDLGLAAITQEHAHYFVGTVEFMAPDMYDEDYTELVDIYAFGMYVLELVTLETPYSECPNEVHVFKRVLSGVRPKALEKVKILEVKDFIEKCLGKPRDRPSASQLLEDPFFFGLEDKDFSTSFNQQIHDDLNKEQQMKYQVRTGPSCDVGSLLQSEVLTGKRAGAGSLINTIFNLPN